MAKPKSFDKAYEELKGIVSDLESDQLSIDKLGDKMKRAKELLKFAKEKLRDVEHNIESMISDD